MPRRVDRHRRERVLCSEWVVRQRCGGTDGRDVVICATALNVILDVSAYAQQVIPTQGHPVPERTRYA